MPDCYSLMVIILSQDSVYLLCLLFQYISSAFRNLQGEGIHILLPMLLTPPSTENIECGWVICSQIAYWYLATQGAGTGQSSFQNWGSTLWQRCICPTHSWPVQSLTIVKNCLLIHTNKFELCTCKHIYKHTFLFFHNKCLNISACMHRRLNLSLLLCPGKSKVQTDRNHNKWFQISGWFSDILQCAV